MEVEHQRDRVYNGPQQISTLIVSDRQKLDHYDTTTTAVMVLFLCLTFVRSCSS